LPTGVDGAAIAQRGAAAAVLLLLPLKFQQALFEEVLLLLDDPQALLEDVLPLL